MRILQIVSTLGGGGAERLVAQLASHMNNDDIKCDVLTLSDVNPVYLSTLQDNRVQVLIAPYKNRYDIRILFYIKKVIRHGKYDVVHAHTFPAIYWTSLAARFTENSIKYIMTEHSTFNRRRDIQLTKPIEKFIYHRYDRVISISEDTRKALLNWLDLKRTHKYLTIPNGIDISFFKDAKPLARDELSVPAEAFLLGVIGSFTKHKNQATLLHAMKLLPENTHAVFAGRGPLLETCVALSEALGVRKRSHFLGFRKDVERVIKTVDIVVIPSLWEGFGLVAVEAMACGKPVAASNVPGLREVICGCGILFDPKNPEDVARSITHLRESESYSYCVIKSKIHAEKYCIDKMTDAYLSIYENMSCVAF